MQRVANLMAVVVVGLGLTSTALGYGLGPAKNPTLEQDAREAASYLKATQLQNRGWAWEIGKNTVADNYGGLVAESLLAAYEQSGDGRFLDAARRYADELVERQADRPTALPYKPDVEFLVRMSEVSGDERYGLAASRWFAQVKATSPTGRDEVGRILIGRAALPDLVGYDVALGIRAALAVDERGYALQLAEAVLAERPRWLNKPQSIYGTVSRAALLDALNMLGEPRQQAVLQELTRSLLREQGDNGAWCMNETQATAYAVRALSGVSDQAGRSAARRGAAWLSTTLLRRGAWADYNDGMPEPFVGSVISAVNAEALSAVILAGKI